MLRRNEKQTDNAVRFAFGLKRSEAEAISRELGQLRHSVGGLSHSAARLLDALQARQSSERMAKRYLPSSYWA